MPNYKIKYELATYEFQVEGPTPGLAELKTCDLLWGKPMDEIIADAKITVELVEEGGKDEIQDEEGSRERAG